MFSPTKSTTMKQSRSVKDMSQMKDKKSANSLSRRSLETKRTWLQAKTRWLKGYSFSLFFRTILFAGLILLPGVLMNYYNVKVAFFNGLPPLFVFGLLSASVMMLPLIYIFVHVMMYHVLPERFYLSAKFGDLFYYMSETIWNITAVIWCGFLWLLLYLIPWTPFRSAMNIDSSGKNANQILSISIDQAAKNEIFFTQLLLVIVMWSAGLAMKKIGMKYLDNRFNISTFVGRIREMMFTDFVIETMREARRTIKLMRNINVDGSPVTENGGSAYVRAVWKGNPVLKQKFDNLKIPSIYLNPDEVPQEEDITSYQWKRLLDHLYSTVLQDDMTLETYGREDMEDGEKGWDIPNLYEYHHLHHFKFAEKLKALHNRRAWVFNFTDEKAVKIGSKLFKILQKDTGDQFLDIKADIMPIFGSGLVGASANDVANTNPPLPTNTDAVKTKEEQLQIAVFNFFQSKGETGLISERDLQLMMKSYRERRRLVESLAGMKSVIEKVSDFSMVLLCVILAMATLSIFGINAFGAAVSFSSAFVSFAFLFGRSAKSLFEGAILIFFVHPFDVGDRVLIDDINFIVSKIDILCTVLERWDGETRYVPNSTLAKKDIVNLRRSKKQSESLAIAVAFKTPNAKIEQLKEKLCAYAASQNSDFDGNVGVSIQPVIDCETVKLSITYTHKSNWQV